MDRQGVVGLGPSTELRALAAMDYDLSGLPLLDHIFGERLHAVFLLFASAD